MKHVMRHGKRIAVGTADTEVKPRRMFKAWFVKVPTNGSWRCGDPEAPAPMRWHWRSLPKHTDKRAMAAAMTWRCQKR